MINELREYRASRDTVDRLHERFERHVLSLFAQHGITVLGFWTDAEDPTRVIYLTRFTDEAERDRCWAGFRDDPEWHAVKAASESNGPLTVGIESRTLRPVPYWPAGEGVLR